MQDAKNTVQMYVEMKFPIIGGGHGLLLRSVRSGVVSSDRLATVEYYVTSNEKYPEVIGGEWVMIDRRRAAGNWILPGDLFMVYTDKTPESDYSKLIRRQYLTNMYHGPLYRQEGRAVREGDRPKKVYTSEAVFAHPVLRLLESLHDTVCKKKLHDLLVETNYHHGRSSVYTRFRGDDRVSYNTPRALTYFPKENLVRVVFALGGVAPDIQVKVKDNETIDLCPAPVKVNITKLFRNEGWYSLRDQMHEDKIIDRLVRSFYENGLGRPHEEPTVAK